MRYGMQQSFSGLPEDNFFKIDLITSEISDLNVETLYYATARSIRTGLVIQVGTGDIDSVMSYTQIRRVYDVPIEVAIKVIPFLE